VLLTDERISRFPCQEGINHVLSLLIVTIIFCKILYDRESLLLSAKTRFSKGVGGGPSSPSSWY
jgi:hypothetical protein